MRGEPKRIPNVCSSAGRSEAASYWDPCANQPSALPPNTLDGLTAISGETPRFSFTIPAEWCASLPKRPEGHSTFPLARVRRQTMPRRVPFCANSFRGSGLFALLMRRTRVFFFACRDRQRQTILRRRQRTRRIVRERAGRIFGLVEVQPNHSVFGCVGV